MKQIKLNVDMMFSEAAVEQAMMDFHNELGHRPFRMLLRVSVFDAQGAISMMIDKRVFGPIFDVLVTPNLRYGEWELESEDIVLKAGDI